MQVTATGTYVSNGVAHYVKDQTYMCSGTLIDRFTVKAPAHCLAKKSFKYRGLNRFTAKVGNYLDPVHYSVYLGLFNDSFPESTPPGVVQASIKAVIPVFLINRLFNQIKIYIFSLVSNI